MAKTNRNNKPWKSSEIQVKKDSKGIFWIVLGDNKVKLPKDIKPSKLTLSQAEGFLGLEKAIDNLVNEVEQERKEESKAPWMIGNKFWQQRSRHGRDKLFATPELLWEAACEYFNWCDENPWMKIEQKKGNAKVDLMEIMEISKEEGLDANQVMKSAFSSLVEIPTARPYTMQGLCSYLNTNKGYFDDFEKSLKDKADETSKDFSVIITRVRETIYQQKFEGATIGAFNASIIARDLGLTDKKDHTSNGETIQSTARILTKAEARELFKDLDNDY